MRKLYKGVGASPGIVIGKAFTLQAEDFVVLKVQLKDSEVAAEVKKFNAAIELTKREIKEIELKVNRDIGSKHSNIFSAHLMILEDPAMTTEVAKQIRETKLNCEHVFYTAVTRFTDSIAKIDDEYLRERANDIRDIGRRVLRNIIGKSKETLADITEESIVFSKDLTPSDTVMLRRDKVIGFCTDMGGKTSHTAIMARALEIPAVVALSTISTQVNTGDPVIVDGSEGVVIVNPSEEDLRLYDRKLGKFIQEEAQLAKLKDLPAETLDGFGVELAANIEIQDELPLVSRHGATGIGLYRTEFLFLNRPDLPDEEEQFRAYMSAAEAVLPRSVIIRTLDVGGDKLLSNLGLPKEENPFLGLRAIRLCLARPEIFRTQLRAILRASTLENIKIMFPMISSVEELRQAAAILSDVKAELEKQGVEFDKNIELGAMIEIPSAAVTADVLAKEVDFFSIGTNDLIQYTLAIDRVNEKLAYMYNPLHPSILRSLKRITSAAHAEGKWVGMCGEMASDTSFTALLIGLGMDELSTAPILVPEVKKVIRTIKMEDARAIASAVLSMNDINAVKKYMKSINTGACKFCS